MTTKQRDRYIASQYSKGENSYVLGEEWSLSPTHVLRIVRGEGIKVRTSAQSLRANHKLPDRQVEAMVRMYRKGKRKGGLPMRLVDVAERYDLSITKVRRVLMSRRVKIRTRGKRS